MNEGLSTWARNFEEIHISRKAVSRGVSLTTNAVNIHPYRILDSFGMDIVTNPLDHHSIFEYH